jgi:hypothetical protein
VIFELIKRDLQWYGRAGLLVVGALCLAMIASTHMEASGVEGFEAGLLAAIIFQPQIYRRATAFEAALPVSGRQLFCARTLSNLFIVGLATLAMAITILRQPNPDSTMLVSVLRGYAILAMAMLLPLSVRVRELAAPKWLIVVLWAIVLATGALLWYTLPPIAMVSLMGTATVVIVIRGWLSVPAALQVAPIEAEGANRPQAFEAPVHRSAIPSWLFLWTAGFGWQAGAYFLIASTLGAFLPVTSRGANASIYFLAIFLFQAVNFSRQKTRWLQSLPISQRQLLAMTLAASVLPLALGAAVGSFISFEPANSESVSSGPSKNFTAASWPDTNVPLEFWHYAPGGVVTPIRAPWGETYPADSISLLGFTLYNPYTTGHGASLRFFDWQFARATEAVHGVAIPQERYAAARKAGLPLVSRGVRIQILLVASYLFVALYLVFFTEFVRWHRLNRPSGRTWLVAGSIVFLLPLALVYLLSMSALSIRGGVFVPMLRAGLIHLSAALPANLVLMSAFALIPILAMYALLDWQFRQSEMTGAVRKALV